MCGICGIVDFSGRMGREERERDVRRMMDRMSHRGPDGEGVRSDKVATLGAVRLAIQDLSEAGNQPWVGLRTGQVLAFNGEIYNAPSLVQMHPEWFVSRRSQCDTEVLSRLWEAQGSDCLSSLRGMFAIAVWDGVSNTLHLVRDRVGEKPLVYAQIGSRFVFASEIKALLALEWIPRTPDWEGLNYGLHYVHVPPPFSAFRAIRKVPPAIAMTVTASGIESARYWRFGANPVAVPEHYPEAVAELTRRLEASVDRVCRADVPVGIMLSGGLDSSSVVASLGRFAKGLPSYRISHDGVSGRSEEAAARAVAARFGTRHEEVRVDDQSVLDMESVMQAYAEPIATLVSIDMHRVCARMAQNVTVVLTGNGGDELFGGYSDFQIVRDFMATRRCWEDLRPFLEGTQPVSEKMQRLAASLSTAASVDLSRYYGQLITERPRRVLEQVFTPRMSEGESDFDPVRLMAALYGEDADPLLAMVHQQLSLSCQYSLVDHSDVSGMHHSMELRSPFLDVDLMDWAASIRWDWKIGEPGTKNPGKQLLRDAMRPILPEEVFRAPKFGFGYSAPYAAWIDQHWDQLFCRDALGDSGRIDPIAVEKLRETMLRQDKGSAHLISGILSLGMWLRAYGG